MSALRHVKPAASVACAPAAFARGASPPDGCRSAPFGTRNSSDVGERTLWPARHSLPAIGLVPVPSVFAGDFSVFHDNDG